MSKETEQIEAAYLGIVHGELETLALNLLDPKSSEKEACEKMRRGIALARRAKSLALKTLFELDKQ